MIELRWLKKTIPTRVEANPGSYGGAMLDGVKTIKVLQYRQKVDHHDMFVVDEFKTWTKWTDVPEVEDET